MHPLPPLPDACVTLLVGLPGAGKSQYLAARQIRAFSSDQVRLLLFDDEAEQGYQSEVFSLLRHMLRARLGAGKPRTFIDATHLTAQERRPAVALAEEFGYAACALFFDRPVELCLERNRQRGRQVADEVILAMAARLRAPSYHEGFARIFRIVDDDGRAEPLTAAN